MSRTRKAFDYTLHTSGETFRGTIYAPTYSAARYDMFYNLSDAWSINFKDFLRMRPSIKRAPWNDVELPERHTLASVLTKEQLHCVVHAFGGSSIKAGYRDYFYGQADDRDLCRCADLGLFTRCEVNTASHGRDMAYFMLTPLGKEVAKGESTLYGEYMDRKYAAEIARSATPHALEIARTDEGDMS